MARVYVRKFDWDEARRLHADGGTYRGIALLLGVTPEAIRRACDDDARSRLDEYRRVHQREGGRCVDCGAARSLNYTMIRNGRSKQRCRACAAVAKTTTVRDNALECCSCHAWKPDADFHSDRNATHRRGKHTQCAACSTIAKRDWRQRNPEKAKAAEVRSKERRRMMAR